MEAIKRLENACADAGVGVPKTVCAPEKQPAKIRVTKKSGARRSQVCTGGMEDFMADSLDRNEVKPGQAHSGAKYSRLLSGRFIGYDVGAGGKVLPDFLPGLALPHRFFNRPVAALDALDTVFDLHL
jgi:hypothetical protein